MNSMVAASDSPQQLGPGYRPGSGSRGRVNSGWAPLPKPHFPGTRQLGSRGPQGVLHLQLKDVKEPEPTRALKITERDLNLRLCCQYFRSRWCKMAGAHQAGQRLGSRAWRHGSRVLLPAYPLLPPGPPQGLLLPDSLPLHHLR